LRPRLKIEPTAQPSTFLARISQPAFDQPVAQPRCNKRGGPTERLLLLWLWRVRAWPFSVLHLERQLSQRAALWRSSCFGAVTSSSALAVRMQRRARGGASPPALSWTEMSQFR
jgi:hypothetical protein